MPKDSNTKLEEIEKRLTEIDEKLDLLLEQQKRYLTRSDFVPETLASLPEHLRKTASTIAALGEATAGNVATETGRARAAESDYLNQLADRGFLKKSRKGREVYFRVYALYTVCSKCGARVLMTLERCAICGASLTPTRIP